VSDRVQRSRPDWHKIGAFRSGLIALVVIAVGCYFGFTKSNPFADRFELSAAFRTANDIKKGAQVRIAGVNVGKVTGVAADGDRGAVVKMAIQDKGLPIHRDATMKIRPRIFLEGNWFVDISPGSPSAPIVQEGETIPVQQTSAPVQFGQVLTALQSDTRQDLQKVLDEYGRALADGGAEGYNRSIDHWTKAFRDSAIVSEATLGVEPGDLSGYLRGADRFARGLNRDPAALKALLTDLAETADAAASEEGALTASIRELPKTLTVGFDALGELNDAFPPLRRLVSDLRPAVRSSGPALDATLPLVRQLRGLVRPSELGGLVRELRPVVPDLTELNTEGVDVQKELRLLSSCTNEVVGPWRASTIPDAQFPASGPVYQEQVKWLPGISSESRSFDANGQYVRSLANGANYAYGVNDGRFFLTGLPIQGVNPPKAPGVPPLRADVACETQQPPDLRTIPGQPPKAIKVNHDAPGAAASRARSRAAAVRWLKRDIKALKLNLKVVDRLITRADIPKLTKAAPR
jgi:phospholipid/cholesterol/gamma-HCH transport system substrate-binding protein